MRTLIRCALPALALLAGTAPLRAQNAMILGRVVQDNAMGLPVEGAVVRLLDAAGYELNYAARTTSGGTFVLRIPPGTYMLQLNRLQFAPARGPSFSIGEDEIYKPTFRLTALSLRLADVRVISMPKVERGREGMGARCNTEKKIVCINREQVLKSDLGYFPSLFQEMDGMQVTATGEIKSLKGWRCLVWMVNRLPVKYFPLGTPPTNLQITLDEMIPTSHDVMGIEVYKEFQDVPTMFKMQAWPTVRLQSQKDLSHAAGTPMPKLFESNQGCGLINVWTIAGW